MAKRSRPVEDECPTRNAICSMIEKDGQARAVARLREIIRTQKEIVPRIVEAVDAGYFKVGRSSQAAGDNFFRHSVTTWAVPGSGLPTYYCVDELVFLAPEVFSQDVIDGLNAKAPKNTFNIILALVVGEHPQAYLPVDPNGRRMGKGDLSTRIRNTPKPRIDLLKKTNFSGVC